MFQRGCVVKVDNLQNKREYNGKEAIVIQDWEKRKERINVEFIEPPLTGVQISVKQTNLSQLSIDDSL